MGNYRGFVLPENEIFNYNNLNKTAVANLESTL